MNSPILTTNPAKPPVPRRRKWLRWVLLAVVLAIGTPLVLMGVSSYSTRGAWEAAEQEASEDMPRWRLLEMEEDRPALADSENSALHMMACVRAGGSVGVASVPTYDAVFEKLPPNVQLNNQQVQLISTEFAKIPKALEDARKLKDMPEGRYPIAYTDDFITTSIPHHQNTRRMGDWLKHDAMLLAQEGNYDDAIDSCQAIINTGRAMKDDPMLITCLIRLAMQRIAVDSLERVLAQGEAGEDRLKATQMMLQKELAEGSFVRGVRGERAGIHHLFVNLRAGKVKADFLKLIGGPGGASLPGVDPITEWITINVPSSMLRHYPDYLRLSNRTVAASQVPLHERGAKVQEVCDETKRSKNPVIRLLAPALQKVEQSDRRVQIYLQCAVVALACERYRLKHEQWPATLDDLVKTKLLDAIPNDPIDNQPLRYRRTKEGVAVYSIGFDNQDNQGNIDRENWNTVGVDFGVRLWDPRYRAREPLPPVGFPAQK